jgi:hypothetical protein
MSEINLKDLTQLELFDLRQKVNNELVSYEKREKKPAYTIKQRDQDTRYFAYCKAAYEALQELVDDREMFEIVTECSVTFLTTEEWKELCEDLE